jgi:predicted AlkP superfamily pyrophosphatase or phosphodiesterase
VNLPGLGRGPLQRESLALRRFAALIPLLWASPVLLSVGCGGPTPVPPTATTLPTPVPTPPPTPKVAILSVDGLRGDALGQVPVPNILGLTRRGAYTWKAQTVYPSMTLPAHTSMLTGFLPTAHGILWDDYNSQKGTCTVPTVFAIAHAEGLRTVLVVGKEKFRHLEVSGTVDTFVLARRGDADVANEAIVQTQAGFDLMFVHFPDVDIAGHAQGWMTKAYLEQLAEADVAIGRLLTALPPETTIIFTSDHGGRATVHGSAIPEDMTIPWIVVGPRIPGRGRELTKPVRTVDTAATALFVLGLRPAAAAAGTVVTEAFAE